METNTGGGDWGAGGGGEEAPFAVLNKQLQAVFWSLGQAHKAHRSPAASPLACYISISDEVTALIAFL